MKDYFVAKSTSFAHTVGVGVCVLFSNCWDCPWGLLKRLVWLDYTYCTCYPFEIAGLYNPRAMLWKGVGNLFPSAKVAVHSQHIIDSLGALKKLGGCVAGLKGAAEASPVSPTWRPVQAEVALKKKNEKYLGCNGTKDEPLRYTSVLPKTFCSCAEIKAVLETGPTWW